MEMYRQDEKPDLLKINLCHLELFIALHGELDIAYHDAGCFSALLSRNPSAGFRTFPEGDEEPRKARGSSSPDTAVPTAFFVKSRRFDNVSWLLTRVS